MFSFLIVSSNTSGTKFFNLSTGNDLLSNSLTESDYIFGAIRGEFEHSQWFNDYNDPTLGRSGDYNDQTLGKKAGSRLWPNARVPYEFEPTIDSKESKIMQLIFSNISSVTNIKFVPR